MKINLYWKQNSERLLHLELEAESPIEQKRLAVFYNELRTKKKACIEVEEANLVNTRT